jgi:SSS family transporter
VVGAALGTPDAVSIAILSALTLLYTFQGGMAAVIWTDVAQMALYIIGSIVALATISSHISGGWPALMAGASAAHKLTFLHFSWSLGQSYTFQAGLIGGCFLTLASHGTDQLMVQRMLAARNLHDSQLALLSSGVIVFLQFILFLLIGAGLFVYYAGHEPMAAPDRIFPNFIVQEMPAGISGLMIAAILAAAMSNLSAALNSLAATSMIDLYLPRHPGLTEQRRIRLSRFFTVGWAVVLFFLALLSRRGGHVVEVGLSIASVLSGAMLGVFLLGALSRRTTENGAVAGMVTGVVINLLLWLQPHDLTVSLLGHPFSFPKIAWIWWVVIGSSVTFVVGYSASLIHTRRAASQ